MNRKLFYVVLISLVMCFAAFSLSAQNSRGLSLGGTTGLITTPTGKISWENTSDFGLDFGYHFSTDRDFGENEHIFNLTFSLFKKLEAGITLDSQPDSYPGEDNSDLLLFGKFQIYNNGQSGMALGGSFQMLDFAREPNPQYGQLYLASTYAGDFLEIPASTTIVFGKTFNVNTGLNQRIDFSMGFDLALFPDVFNGYVRWISEFSNYSYSADSIITNADARGAFNTGLRIDILRGKPYGLVIDATLMDVFDEGINKFAVGGSFGISLK